MIHTYIPRSINRQIFLITAFFIVFLPRTVTADMVVPNPVVTPIPQDAGIKQHAFVASPLDLSAYGYGEQEFTVAGTANTYNRDGQWRSDGKWGIKVARADRPYTTRILVRRPLDPAKFNGIVVVEWMNNTAFMDVDVIWGQSHHALMREGFAWVGVSAQAFGVTVLKNWDRERYGSLRHGNDGVSYDIFSQVGQAVRSQSDLILGGLPVTGVMGAGESQSAIRLTTYVNAFQAAAKEVYDGILLYSRFPLSAPLKSGITLLAPQKVYIRDDNALKVLQLETEQDVFFFMFRLARQDDTDNLRTWEVAGASHYDDHGVSNLFPQYRRDWPQLASVELVCRNSPSKIPSYLIVNSALVWLSKWMTTGEAPPQSPRIDYVSGRVVRDEFGNALGGIRLPQMEVPTAMHNYNNFGRVTGGGNWLVNLFACPFLGNTVPFDQATLQELYPSHDDYVTKFTAAADAARDAGFLLPADRDDVVAEAQAAAVP